LCKPALLFNSDPDSPSMHFQSGISNTKTIPAKHMVPLLVQVQVSLGFETVFLTKAQGKKVHQVYAILLHLAWQLHMGEYSDSNITSLMKNIDDFLKACKSAFKDYSPTDFAFAKFHNVLHTDFFIRRYGALWCTCSGRWEHFHKWMKFFYTQVGRIDPDMHFSLIFECRLANVKKLF
jgi:hypothetical protein